MNVPIDYSDLNIGIDLCDVEQRLDTLSQGLDAEEAKLRQLPARADAVVEACQVLRTRQDQLEKKLAAEVKNTKPLSRKLKPATRPVARRLWLLRWRVRWLRGVRAVRHAVDTLRTSLVNAGRWAARLLLGGPDE